jgi:hypothetical protein
MLSSEELSGGQGQLRAARLTRADTNHDGAISREEFLSRPQRLFDRFDANHDDVLDATEIATARAAMVRMSGLAPNEQQQGN